MSFFIEHIRTEVKKKTNCDIQLSEFVEFRIITYLLALSTGGRTDCMNLLISGFTEAIEDRFGDGFHTEPFKYTIHLLLLENLLVCFSDGW